MTTARKANEVLLELVSYRDRYSSLSAGFGRLLNKNQHACEVLQECSDVFESYASQHYLEGNNKEYAATRALAKKCREAIKASKLGPEPPVAKY